MVVRGGGLVSSWALPADGLMGVESSWALPADGSLGVGEVGAGTSLTCSTSNISGPVAGVTGVEGREWKLKLGEKKHLSWGWS